MVVLEQNLNQAKLTQLARREHFTFFGLTLPYLVLVGDDNCPNWLAVFFVFHRQRRVIFV